MIFILKDEKLSLERRLASTEADLQQKLSSCQEVVIGNGQITLLVAHFPLCLRTVWAFWVTN